MSNLITNGDFASSANTSTNEDENNWYNFHVGLENSSSLSVSEGTIFALYPTSGTLIPTVSALESNFDDLFFNLNTVDFVYALLDNKLTVYISPQSYIDQDYSYGNNPNLPASFNVESSVENLIALDSSKIYTLSYSVIANYFETDYYLSDWSIKVQLVPTNSSLDVINFDLFENSFNVSYQNEHQVAYPATGNYQLSFVFTLTNAMLNGGGRDSTVRQKFEIDNASLVEYTEHIGTPVISDIEGNQLNVINFNLIGNEEVILEASEDPEDYIEHMCTELTEGWFIIGIPLLLTSIKKGHSAGGVNPEDYDADANGNVNIQQFLYNHIYTTADGTVPLYYQDPDQFIDSVQIIKNNAALIYWPQFNFNSIGNIKQFEGYQIRTNHGSSLYLKYSGNPIFDSITNSTDVQYELVDGTAQDSNELVAGWNMISFPSTQPIDAVAFFQEFTDLGVLQIVKNNSAEVYWPEFFFNGIGNLIPGQGYQVRLHEF